MGDLFLAQQLVDFGPSQFLPPGTRPIITRIPGRSASKLREQVRSVCPKLPGVYGMLDGAQRLIYIGKSKSLRSRLLSYFRVDSRNPKAGRIIKDTRSILWEESTSEFAALLRELELIRRYLPRFNVLGKPGMQRYCYVALGRAPAPYAFVERKATGKEIGLYGPVVGQRLAWEAVRRINDLYQLRDCSQRQKLAFADEPDLFPMERSPGCLRVEIGTCSGACVGGCTRADYLQQVERAKAFLEGRDLRLLDELRQQMEAAATAQQFERAAAVRDRLVPLEWLAERLTWLRNARDQHSFVYALPGCDEVELWYFIHRGQVRAVLPKPTTATEQQRAITLSQQIFEKGEPIGKALPSQQVDSVLLVAAWFRRNPQERERLISVANLSGQPDLSPPFAT